MKILVLTNKLPYPPRDGGSIATLNMIKGLQLAGNKVTCLAINTLKHTYPVEEIPPEILETIRILKVDCNCSIRPLIMGSNLLFSKKPYIAERFNIQVFRDQLANLLKTESFDIIQLEGPYPGQYLDVIRRYSNARVSLRAHNVEHHIWERKAIFEKSPFKRWYLKNLAKRLKRFEMEIVHQTDFLIPISKLDESYFRDHGFQKPSLTITAGLTMDDYPLNELPEEPSIFFIGALDWLPNQEGLSWFIRNVLDRVVSELPDLKFHVAGRNAPPSFEKKLKHPQITYHGEVKDAVGFIQSFRVMVVPLLTGSGIRIKILEGLAMGRPVVTTSAGIEGLEAGALKYILVEDDPQRFSGQIVTQVQNKQGPVSMATAARQYISKNFDNFELSSRLNQFYKSEV
jgi:glycosyltransferase involved in cell wall biosynthesis